jgi:predicted RNA binding protein YcfA (HicA-like mRNA interferase family)
MKFRDIKKEITIKGWIEQRISGGHAIFYHPFRNDKIVIPVHCGDINSIIVRKILEQLNGRSTVNGKLI